MSSQSEAGRWEGRSWIREKTEVAPGGPVTCMAEGHCWAQSVFTVPWPFLQEYFNSPMHAALPAYLEGLLPGVSGTHSEFWERSAENSQENQAPTPPATFSAPGCGHSPFTRGNPELSSPRTPTQGDPLAKGSDVNPTVLALLLLSLRQ